MRDNGVRPLALETIKAKINQSVAPEMASHTFETNSSRRYVHKYDEEYSSVKKARRPGRPPSARQYVLEVKISDLRQEYKKGFCKLTGPFPPFPLTVLHTLNLLT